MFGYYEGETKGWCFVAQLRRKRRGKVKISVTVYRHALKNGFDETFHAYDKIGKIKFKRLADYQDFKAKLADTDVEWRENIAQDLQLAVA